MPRNIAKTLNEFCKRFCKSVCKRFCNCGRNGTHPLPRSPAWQATIDTRPHSLHSTAVGGAGGVRLRIPQPPRRPALPAYWISPAAGKGAALARLRVLGVTTIGSSGVCGFLMRFDGGSASIWTGAYGVLASTGARGCVPSRAPRETWVDRQLLASGCVLTLSSPKHHKGTHPTTPHSARPPIPATQPTTRPTRNAQNDDRRRQPSNL
jgi:hypothetical protein